MRSKEGIGRVRKQEETKEDYGKRRRHKEKGGCEERKQEEGVRRRREERGWRKEE